jgi:long-chain fatty acid adenylase/transferase FadD26
MGVPVTVDDCSPSADLRVPPQCHDRESRAVSSPVTEQPRTILDVLHRRSKGQLFIMGRLKDLVIIDGRNHYPDDIEATVSELTAGRVAAFSVNTESSENLVVIAEFTASGLSDDEILREIRAVEARVIAAVSADHGVRVADLVLVSLAAIPTTTSGKVRRTACAEQYRQGQFERVR